MIRYLLLFLTIFIYSSSAFDIVIECTDVNGRSAFDWKMLYNRDDYDIINSSAEFECSGHGGVNHFINRLPNTIELEDGDSFQWYDLFDISYNGIKDQTLKHEYIDTVKTDLNTFIRKVEWSGDDTTTYKIHISIDKD